jgi:hypothetical protein
MTAHNTQQFQRNLYMSLELYNKKVVIFYKKMLEHTLHLFYILKNYTINNKG